MAVETEQDATTPPALREQLAERDEEILRLRDLLIARDAELGAARGRLAVLEQHSQRLAGLAARIPVPGLGRILAVLNRMLRG
jgi:hypothetical protein